MTKLPAFKVRESGRALARMQNGVVQVYGMVIAVGFLAVMAWYWAPHSRIEAQFFGDTALLTTPAGLGYEYRWDANSDGEFETGWTAKGQTTFEYSDDDARGLTILIQHQPTGLTKRHSVSDQWRPLPLDSVMPDDEPRPKGRQPEVRTEEGAIVFLIPGPDGKARKVRRGVGEVARFGSTLVYATPLVEATVEVRNAFGNSSSSTKRIALPATKKGPSRASLHNTGGRR